MLSREITGLVTKRTAEFKYGSLMIPLVNSWNCETKRVVGVIIISGINNSKGLNKREKELNDLRLKKATCLNIMKDIVHHITDFYNISFMEVTNLKLLSNYRSICNMCKAFRHVKDIKCLLRDLRFELATVLGYEDVALLVKDHTNQFNTDNFVAVAPNLLADKLTANDKIEVGYYTLPTGSITKNIIFSLGDAPSTCLYTNPRDEVSFYEGIDNLSPVVQLREIIYTVLMLDGGERIGVVQYINKKRGYTMKHDIDLVDSLSHLLANYISVMMQSFKLMATIDAIHTTVNNTASSL